MYDKLFHKKKQATVFKYIITKIYNYIQNMTRITDVFNKILVTLEFQYSYSTRWIVATIDTSVIFLSEPRETALIFASLNRHLLGRAVGRHQSSPQMS